MSAFSTDLRYGVVAQIFHWLTAVLVLSAWLVSGSRDLMTLHQTLGVAVFAVVALRLVWRAVDRRPGEVAMPKAMALASRAFHWLLYAMMLALVGTAVAGSWLEGHAITVYGLGAIGPYLMASRDLGHALLEVHQTLGTAIIWAAGLHAAAALFHHFYRRDRVLRRMLPAG
jgi:cytochrome b561